MKVIVHYPTSETAQRELSRRAAQIHAEAITRRINDLSCSQEQKLKLINSISEAVTNKVG